MGFLKNLLHRCWKVDTIEAIRQKQQSFRELVTKNNRVLELIADAGEKLGGEYIFDSQYLKTLDRELSESVRSVIDNLNTITGDRYRELVEIQKAIEAKITASLERRTLVPTTDYVIPLEQIDEALSDAVGAKMARLGEIHQRLGCAIPEGFVITAHASRVLLESAGIAAVIRECSGPAGPAGEAGAEPLPAIAARIQKLIRNASIPRGLLRAIRNASHKVARKAGCRTLAVRSSALGEDGQHSFAGQYRTLLGVPPGDVPNAYKKVLASLYSVEVMRYRQEFGLHPIQGHMAVGCLGMVESRAGGVLYTLDPLEPGKDVMVVAAVRGLGKTVVDGTAVADRFEVSRRPPHAITWQAVGDKASMIVVEPARRVVEVPLPDGERDAPAVNESELCELAGAALRIEKYMKSAQDIEWAVDETGRVFVLQARRLRIEPHRAEDAGSGDLARAASGIPVLLQGRGEVACRGIGFGRVRVVAGPKDLEELSGDVVLVAKTSTPWLAAAMGKASAVITDIGTATGHLATIARELRIPTILDTGIATHVLREAGEVTVDAEENIVYQGRFQALLDYQLLRSSSSYEEKAEFQLLRRMLKRIAPLHLRDPASSDFAPARCRTYHDIIRFAHEKAIQGLIEGYHLGASRRRPHLFRFDTEIPLDLFIIDLGGGLRADGPGQSVTVEKVGSHPLRAVLEGLATPGVWETGPADMDLRSFIASATQPFALTGPLAPKPERNLALITRDYLNLNLKLGYHYNIVDCFMTERRNDNFIYFRFAGGATELARRTRRAGLLKRILELHDFMVESRQDLVIARIKKIAFDNMVSQLIMIGRLIGFTRQLDIYLKDDSTVERCVTRFMEGRYRPSEP